MGVKGLATFMTRNNLMKRVDIADFVEKHKQPGVETTIIVDGNNCYSRLNDFCHEEAWYSGGQFQEYCQQVEKLVQAFEGVGVTLVVAFTGHTMSSLRSHWVEKTLRYPKDIQRILDCLYYREPLPPLDMCCYQTPANQAAISKYIFSKYCKVILTPYETLDDAIIEYAKENNCLAVLTDDSDYVVTPEPWFVLSMRSLDLDSMQTTVYDRQGLVTRLNLQSVRQLPLLGTLCGGDILTYEMMSPWHKKLFRNTGLDKLVHVARFVQNYPYDTDLRRADFVRIAESISTSLPHYSDFNRTTRTDLIESICKQFSTRTFTPRYRPSTYVEWEKIFEHARKMSDACKLPSCLVAIMGNERMFELALCYEHYLNNIDNLPFAGVFWRPLRAKVYGILLKEYPREEPIFIEEWVLEERGSLGAKQVDPVDPTSYHPGMMALWDEDRSDLHDQRWSLFYNAIFDKEANALEPLQNLADNLKVPVLIIVQMVKQCHLKTWEWEALLRTADQCKNFLEDNNAFVNDIVNETKGCDIPINTRALTLSTIYLRGAGTIEMLTSACGFPVKLERTMSWKLFDGLLFQKYYSAKEQSPNIVCSELIDAHAFVHKYKNMF